MWLQCVSPGQCWVRGFYALSQTHWRTLMPVKKWSSMIRFVFQKGILLIWGRMYSRGQTGSRKGSFDDYVKWFGCEPGDREKCTDQKQSGSDSVWRSWGSGTSSWGRQHAPHREAHFGHASSEVLVVRLCGSGERCARILLLMGV